MRKPVLALFLLFSITVYGTHLTTLAMENATIIELSENQNKIRETERTAAANITNTETTYVGIAKYYDNRKCVVTSTHDDLIWNTSAWENCLSMLTQKKIYHTIGIITNHSRFLNDWNFMQYWVNQGYTEAASHSRNHVHVPYTGSEDGKQKISYEWQINGSKNDIIGNLTLPNWWRCGETEYVYAWIEPYSSCDNTVREWLGDCYYLCDRRVGSGVYNFVGWDNSKGLFNRVGYTVEMGNPPWGGGDTSVSSLNSKFNTAYDNGKLYHLMTHPGHVNWTEGSYADQHTDYISNRTDVWYVPFGLLYLYHWVDVRNIINVTSAGSGLNKVFKLSIGATDHLNYGVSYPITYMFDIPSSWTNGYVYYRYLETDPWILMENKSSQDFFNGIDASRFNLSNHKAYVSAGFSNRSHEVYLQLRAQRMVHDVAVSNITISATEVYIGQITNVTVTIGNEGNTAETFNVTAYANITAIQTKTVTNLAPSNQTTLTFTWNTTNVAPGNYTISANATQVPGENDTDDNTLVDSIVNVKIPGDVNGDGTVAIYDLARIGRDYGATSESPGWDEPCDINVDDIIDIYDLAICGKNYGKTA